MEETTLGFKNRCCSHLHVLLYALLLLLLVSPAVDRGSGVVIAPGGMSINITITVLVLFNDTQ